MVGHLSDGFMKFKNDEEEIMKEELALALKEMWTLGRYDELLFIMDSCQSFTLCDNFDKVDESICIGSSVLGENSYAHHTDMMLGVSIIDQFTRELLIFLDKDKKTSPTAKFSRKDLTIQDFNDSVQSATIDSLPKVRDDTCKRKANNVAMKDFFHMSNKAEKPVITTESKKYPDLSNVVAAVMNTL